MTVSFFVPAEPQAKGSMRAFVPKGWNRPVVTSTNKHLKSYESLVRMEANKIWNAPVLDRNTPVNVWLVFCFIKPRSTPKKVVEKLTKPDLDKLIRPILDAMTGIVWVDDSQVVRIVASKIFTERPGTAVRISTEPDEGNKNMLG